MTEPVATPGLAPTPSPDAAIMQQIQAEYPAIGQHEFNLTHGTGPGYVEFYPPDEEYNPLPGKPTIEVRDQGRALTGEAKKNLLLGEALHHVGRVDPTFKGLKDQFMDALTPQQLAVDQQAYEHEKQIFGDLGTFDQWMERSRSDAYIRGYLFPSGGDDWRQDGGYTPEQIKILDAMHAHLKRAPKTDEQAFQDGFANR